MEEDKKKIHHLLDGIQRKDIDRYMEMCYESIIQYPNQILEYEGGSTKSKIGALDNIINHFAQKDMFEKCHRLKLIKEKLKC
tara:strand:- start:351 stop:596 length:246 start_codon:yes stop_codon:yes gene_type:complete